MISSLSDFVLTQCLVHEVSDSAGFVPNRWPNVAEKVGRRRYPRADNASTGYHFRKHLRAKVLRRQPRVIARCVRKVMEAHDPACVENSRLRTDENDRAFGG